MSAVDRETCVERMRRIGVLAGRGWPSKKIARHMGLSFSTVYLYRRHIRQGRVPVGSGNPESLGRRHKPLFDDALLASSAVELYESGLTMMQVAARFGTSRSTVGRALHARGVPVRSR